MGAGTPLGALAGILSMVMLWKTFSDRVPPPLMWGWVGFTTLAFLLPILTFRRFDPEVEELHVLRQRLRRYRFILPTTTAAWAAGIPIFAWYGTGAELVLLGVIATALFVGVLLAHRTMPEVALFHIVALGTALVIAAAVGAGLNVWNAVILISVYGAALIASVGFHNRSLLRAADLEAELRASESTVRILLHEYEAQSTDLLWTIDSAGNFCEVSNRLAKAAGKTPEELEGSSLLAMFKDGPERDRLAGYIVTRAPFRDLIVPVVGGDEEHFWRLAARPRGDGRMTGVAHDATEGRLIEARMSYLAHHDDLTGLANRFQFNEKVAAALDNAEGDRNRVALFNLDLDDFKGINDVHGHLTGDALLRAVAGRLDREVRDSDLVARLGGDEFAILMTSAAGDGMLFERAHRFLGALRDPFEIDGQMFRISTSVGVARCRDELCDSEELMRRADVALFAAKAKGRDQFAMFDDAMDREARERRTTEADLREALGRDEFRLHYQPVIDLDSGDTVAYEALVRWQHPARGLLGPDKFLAATEDSGLIIALGDWIIRQALRELSAWKGDFRIAINLSPSQIRSPHLISTVEDAIRTSGIAAHRVEFEITEHVLLQDGGVCFETIRQLRALGTQIALDDFGTGYSSLSYLRNFPIDRIKIDREFVADLDESESAQAIVSAITRLAEALGMSTTAEGIERPEQLHLLRKLGCREAQGFLILEPVEASRLSEARDQGLDLIANGSEVVDYRAARERALRRRGQKS